MVLYSFNFVLRLAFLVLAKCCNFQASTVYSPSYKANPSSSPDTNKIPVLHFDWTPLNQSLLLRDCLKLMKPLLQELQVGENPSLLLLAGTRIKWEPTPVGSHSQTSISYCRDPANLYSFTKNINTQEDLPSEI